MPNWANGYITVNGNPKDVENFCELFIFDDETGNKQGKYFARSFIHQDWKEFKEEHLGESEAGFSVDFAWSCWSCMFEGYPEQYKKDGCVTLEWAMKKYNVNVEIETEEGGMGFEEHITTKNGKPVYESKYIPEYTCQKCFSKQQIGKGYELEDVECYGCGEVGRWQDELIEIMKAKLKIIQDKKNEKNKRKIT